MARYRKIETRIWNDEKFHALSDRAKLVFLLILTHPHMTSLGAMRATIPGMASELGWTEKAFREAFTEVFRKALVEHDEKACFVALPRFLRYNRPESPNVVKSWADAVDLLPECNLKTVLLQRVKDFAEAFGEAFAKALPEAFRKALPNQEQEQEQEQEQDTPPKPPRGRECSPPGFDAWYEAYPRRTARANAAKAFPKALQQIRLLRSCDASEALAYLMERTALYATSDIGRGDKQYVPHPATWLNGGCYDDDPAAWQRSQRGPTSFAPINAADFR
jgi:hypothetical protein